MILNTELYLRENLDENATIKLWENKNNLPIFLKNIYNFYEVTLLDNICILLEFIDEIPRIDGIKKHLKQINKLTNLQIIIYHKEITRYRRKVYIENRIPFIIGSGQVYLPFLGLDLKMISKLPKRKTAKFSTSAQLAYLLFLYNEDLVINTTEFANRFKFSNMTASRALNDLYNLDLLFYEIKGKTGRSKEYRRIPDPDYFAKGKHFIKSPVKKIVYAKEVPNGTLIAGLEALAELSMINPPQHFVRAIDNRGFNELNIEIIDEPDIVENKRLVEIQIWRYNPRLFSNKEYVDTMSLYVSLQNENDERIKQALEGVLRYEKWYTD